MISMLDASGNIIFNDGRGKTRSLIGLESHRFVRGKGIEHFVHHTSNSCRGTAVINRHYNNNNISLENEIMTMKRCIIDTRRNVLFRMSLCMCGGVGHRYVGWK